MLSIGLLSLICALTAGVFGFGNAAPPHWTWEKVSFFLLLSVSMIAFVESTLSRPSLLWEVLDDIQRKRFQHLRQEQAHGLTKDPPEGGPHLQGI